MDHEAPAGAIPIQTVNPISVTMHADSPPALGKWHLVAAFAVTLIAIRCLYPIAGPNSAILSLVPVIFTARRRGLLGGVTAALVQSVLVAQLYQVTVRPSPPFTRSSFFGMLLWLVVGAAVGYQRDLSRKLQAELAINKQLRLREHETLAALPDAMIRIHPDGTCRIQGRESLRPLAEALTEAVGCPFPAHLLDQVSKHIRSVASDHIPQGIALELPGPSYVDLRCLHTADGSVLLVLRNVTEERLLQKRLIASENLASLGTLAAGLAHEINNPLTYVVANMDTIANQPAGADRSSVRPHLDAALEGCRRIRDLVREFLETSRGHEARITTVSIPKVLETVLVLVRSQVRHRATLTCDYAGVPNALGHRGKLVQVVVNLVVNASQAFIDGHAVENKISIHAFREGEQVVIQVADNGPGMDAKTRERALDPFFTTKTHGQGSGLGLFLSHSIMTSFGGSLEIESKPGCGTTVTVRMPVSYQELTSCASIPVERLGATNRCVAPGGRVLVVDDEPQIRRALDRLLGSTYEVSPSSNGAEALARLLAGETFDVILCDLLMPQMTGIELYEEMERRWPDQAARAVFLTGGTITDTARVFVDRHAARIIRKPFERGEIEAMVATVLAARRLEQCAPSDVTLPIEEEPVSRVRAPPRC